MRQLLTDSELFDANHKERLLKKLESLQAEVHKQVSSLDKFWGLIGEAGVVLGKFIDFLGNKRKQGLLRDQGVAGGFGNRNLHGRLFLELLNLSTLRGLNSKCTTLKASRPF